MIAKFTTGAERHRLGFAEAVIGEFAFLESTFGFHQVEQGPTFVRYESDRLFLNVFHGRGSYEIGVELGRLSNPESYYRLPSLVAGLAPTYTGRTVFQASSRRAVNLCVAETARILREHCGAALAGEASALQTVEREAVAASERVTLQARFGAIVDRADRAWESKDLSLTMELYQRAEPALNDTRRRRLDYLRRREGATGR